MQLLSSTGRIGNSSSFFARRKFHLAVVLKLACLFDLQKGLGFLVGNMWSVCFAFLAVFVAAFENVNAQDYSDFYRRLRNLRNPVFISSHTGNRRYFELQNEPSSEESQENVQKVRIDVYYETDCPDSMRFITKQIYPLYKGMNDIADIHLYPYGKAYKYFDEDKNKYSFSCHHGPSECYGNSVQACALKLYSNQDDAFELINCMEDYPRPSRSGQKCARRLSVNWDKIQKCATGELGYQLMNELANKTESLNPNLYFVPWVVFDNVFDQGDFRKAQRDLKGVVCSRYKGNHPGCKNQS